MTARRDGAPTEVGATVRTIACQRQTCRNQTNSSPLHQQVLARSAALNIATAAMSTGTFPPTQQLLDSVAALASSLHWDAWLLVEATA
jgi:hypothetical protein